MKPISQRHLAQRHVVAAVILCSLFAGRTVLAATGQASWPSEFDAYLAEGYRQMAGIAALATNDQRVISYFKKRDALANQGSSVDPQKLEPLDLDSWTLHEATYARKQLIERLDGGARQHQPLLAAIAQVNFDCWVVPLPRRLGVPDGDECRRRFYFAFAGLADNQQQLSSVPFVELAQLIQKSTGPAGALPPRQIVVIHRQPPTSLAAELDTESADCGSNGLLLSFTGPTADNLIHALRECTGSGAPGADNSASADPTPAGVIGNGGNGDISGGSGDADSGGIGNGTSGSLGAAAGALGGAAGAAGSAVGGAAGGVGGALGSAVGAAGGAVGGAGGALDGAVGAVRGALGGGGKGLGHSRL
jgi:hypothetical protein